MNGCLALLGEQGGKAVLVGVHAFRRLYPGLYVLLLFTRDRRGHAIAGGGDCRDSSEG